MNALRSYLITVMMAAVASALCVQFSDERFRKYVKYIAALAMLLVLTVPMLSLVSEIGDIHFSVDETVSETVGEDSPYLSLLGKQLSKNVGDRIASVYGIPREAIYVTLTLDTADLAALRIDSIDVVITDNCDEGEISRTLTDEFACTVRVRKETSCEGTD